MNHLARDVRLAVRRSRRRPASALAVVAILALGLGVATTVFSVAHRVLHRALPVPALDRLVVAWEVSAEQANLLIEVSHPHFLDWRAQAQAFEDLAAFGSVSWGAQLRGSWGVESVSRVAVTGSFFDTLRAAPARGRTLRAEDDLLGAPRVVVLSHALWQRRFGGEEGIVGRTIRLSDEPFTVIGVMPRDFDFPHGTQTWTAVGRELAEIHRRNDDPPRARRGLGVLYVAGRLKPGASRATAQSELSRIAGRLTREDQMSAAGYTAQVVPLVDHHLGRSTRRAIEVLGAAGALLLLLSCANAAVLLLVQAFGRRGDLAVRRALGAGALSLAAEELAAATLLAAVAGIVGMLLAFAAVAGLRAYGPTDVPGLADVTLNAHAAGFALIVTFASALLVAAAPVWIATRPGLPAALKAGTAGAGLDPWGWAMSRLLVSAEIALSVVLLVGCGLMVRSLDRLTRVDLGFIPDRALSFSVARSGEGDGRAFARTLIDRIGDLPGVEAAGGVSLRPLELGPIGNDNWVLPEGGAMDWDSVRARSVLANWEAITPGYFRAVGTALVEGRAFDARDTTEGAKVVIVSRGLARRLWPGRSAIGRRLNTHGAPCALENEVFRCEWQTVVGVAADARYRGIQNPRPDIYVPERQAPSGVGYYVARASGDPLALIGALREQVKALDPHANLEELTTLRTLVDRALSPWRFARGLLGTFAAAALALTGSGLFAVLYHFVSRRTGEIAIRIALGAGPRRIRELVIGQGMSVLAAGVLAGLALSTVLTRALSALLYEVAAGDVWSHAAGITLLCVVALIACLLPAWRAARIDPAAALRGD